MPYKHPLNIKVIPTRDNGRPVSLSFNYEAGNKRFNLDYFADKHPKIADYVAAQNIGELDLTEVKTEEDAQKFSEKFLENYPVPEQVYEHLFTYTALRAKNEQNSSLQRTAYDLVYNMAAKYLHSKETDADKMHGAIRDMLQHLAEGKDAAEFEVRGPLLARLGFKRDRTYKNIYAMRQSCVKVQKNWPAVKEEAAIILKDFPEKPFANMEEAKKFTIDIAYGSEKRRDAEKKKEYALKELVVGDFIDIACRECVSAEVDKRLKQHLKELKNQEKVKAALEKRKAAKAKNIAENKETWRKEQKKAADKKAARTRLAQKGLIAEDSARNGKLSHWGDSRS